MSGTTNAVFRPDVTDYGMPPQNRLAPQPTWADAATYNAQAVSDYIAQQRAKSEQMGLWDSSTGLPTGAGVVNAAQQYGSGMLMGTTAPGIRAFHGSPYDFERFDTSKIGTGEGAQAYGHGLYMAENEGVARQYRDVLAGRSETDTPEGLARFWANMQGGHEGGISHLESVLGQMDKYPNSYAPGEADKINSAIQYLKSGGDLSPAGGHMYEVNIGADPEQFLHWDKPLSEQSPQVQQAAGKAWDTGNWGHPLPDDLQSVTGQEFHNRLAQKILAENYRGNMPPPSYSAPASSAEALQQAGIPGIRYLDQGSRGAGEGTHNYVVFDANTIDILRKYGLAGLGIGLGAAATGTQQQSQ